MNNRESSAAMRDSLRLYGGDTRIRDENGDLCARCSGDLLYGDREAYRTLNALLFPGISNEYSRIFRDKHDLNPVFLRRLEETIQIYCNIFQLMVGDRAPERGERPELPGKRAGEGPGRKGLGGEGLDREAEIVVRRVERQASVEMLKQGRTISFVSASKAGYSREFADKDGVVLLEIHAKPDVPYVDFEKVLGREYGRAEEREVLFPPFADFEMEEASMSSGERKSVRDKHNRPPMAKYRVEMKGGSGAALRPELCLPGNTEGRLLGGKEAAARAVEAMMRGEWDNDFSDYILWKEQLQKYIRGRFFQMRGGEGGGTPGDRLRSRTGHGLSEGGLPGWGLKRSRTVKAGAKAEPDRQGGG